MEKVKTLEERYRDEILTNNENIIVFRKCKDCKYRDKNHEGYKKYICDWYTMKDPKPLIIKNNGDCDFYERGK